MADKEALGGQGAPHGSLRIILFLLVCRHRCGGAAAWVRDADVAQNDIAYGVTRQSGDGASRSPGIVNGDVREGYVAQRAHIFYLLTLVVASCPVAQPDEDRALRARCMYVAYNHIRQFAAVNHLNRDGRYASALAEEERALVVARPDGDVADMAPQERDKYIEFLWEKANTEIDNQVLDVAKCYDIDS